MLANPLSKKFTFKKYYHSLNGVGKPCTFTTHAPKETETKMAAHMEWIKDNGIKLHKNIHYPAYFQTTDGFTYPGFAALEDIKENDLIMTVPSKLILSTQVAYYSELNSFFRLHVNIFSSKTAAWEDYVLILYLMMEESKGEKSLWNPMLQLWPAEVDVFYCWSEKDIKEIQCMRIIKDAIMENNALRSSWEMLAEILNLYPKLFQKKYFNYSNYVRYWALLSSRIFNSFICTTAFTPYAEFVNHENVDTYYKTLQEKDLTEIESTAEVESSDVNSEFDLDDRYTVLMLPTNDNEVLGVEVTSNEQADAEAELKNIRYLLDGVSVSDEERATLAQIDDKFSKDCEHIQILRNSKQAYEKGSQIYMSYGKHSNGGLLSKYSFMLANNKYNYAVIELDVAKKYDDVSEATIKKVFGIASKLVYDMGIKIYHQKLSNRKMLNRVHFVLQNTLA